MGTLVAVAVASAAGGSLRYLVGLATPASSGFPIATLAINLSGAFVLGLLSALFAERVPVEPAVRAALMVGFLGSYTTFSTLTLETWQLFEGGAAGTAAAYLAGSVLVGIAATLAGIALGRSIG